MGGYDYAGTSLHGVSAIDDNGVITSYDYDSHGNMTHDDSGRTIDYTAFDKPYAIYAANNERTEFVYGSSRGMIKREDYDGLGMRTQVTRYVGGMEYLSDGDDLQANRVKRYVGNLLQTIDLVTGQVETRYLHRDHLGSIDAMTGPPWQLSAHQHEF